MTNVHRKSVPLLIFRYCLTSGRYGICSRTVRKIRIPSGKCKGKQKWNKYHKSKKNNAPRVATNSMCSTQWLAVPWAQLLVIILYVGVKCTILKKPHTTSNKSEHKNNNKVGTQLTANHDFCYFFFAI